MRPLPYIPLFAAILIGVAAAEAAWSWNPLRVFRKGRKEVHGEQFREDLDRELPGALIRLSGRLCDDRRVQAIAGILVLLLGGKGALATRKLAKGIVKHVKRSANAREQGSGHRD